MGFENPILYSITNTKIFETEKNYALEPLCPQVQFHLSEKQLFFQKYIFEVQIIIYPTIFAHCDTHLCFN